MSRESGIRRMEGVALITAVLVVALATTAAVAMVSRQMFDVRRSANLLAIEQGLLYQQGLEGWAMQVLRRDSKQNKTDSSADSWATALAPLPVTEGMIAGKIEDLQGRFNLNSLWSDGKVDALALERFKRLMMVVGVEEFTANSLLDWIDNDIDPRLPDGAEDDRYLGAEMAYRTANRYLMSRSELLQVAGMNIKDYQRLAPYVVALPTATSINVNSASSELIRSLADGISAADADAVIEARGEEGFKSVVEFLQQPALAGRGVSANGLSVASNYFSLHSRLKIGPLENGYQAMIFRNDKGNAVLVRRTQGEL